MRTAEDIVAAWRYRRDHTPIIQSRMQLIRDTYNGDLVLPVGDGQRPMVANLILNGIDQTAARIASVAPQVWFPPTKPGQHASEQRADHRRDAIMGWWDDNGMAAIMRQRALHLVAYGRSPVILWPNFATGCPEWKVRNPLGTFPSDDLVAPLQPADLICAYNKPWAWIKQHYPEVAARESTSATADRDESTQCVILEYVDADALRMIYAGPDTAYQPGWTSHQWQTNTWGSIALDMVEPIVNLAGVPLCTNPQREVLDRVQGQFDQTIGMYEGQAKLTALELAAVERDIFPDVFLISRPGERGEVVGGVLHDGRSGEINVISGGDIKAMNTPPGYQTMPMADRLERGMRIVGGIAAEYGGESTQNIRTGRRGDAVLSAMIDFPIKVAQEVLAESLKQENLIGIRISKAWFGGQQVTYHYTERNRIKSGSYTPDEVWTETDHHTISYPVAGADQNSLVVGMGQRIALGTLSRQSAAELDPLIADPELEKDRITAEALDTALLASVGQAAAQGALDPAMVARITDLVKSGKAELADAIATAQAEAQAQAAAAQAPTGAEALMAQTVAQGTGAPATVPEVGQGLQNLAGAMTALRKTNTRTAGRQALGGAY